jgi:predicted nucleic acid-binding protein
VIVLDASVAAKWFIEELDSDKALKVLDLVQDAPHEFAVPELFFVEMLNFLGRTEPIGSRLQGYMADLENLGLVRLAHSHEVVQTAAVLMCARGLSGYDATYAATAQVLSATWLTADARAHKRVAELNLSKLL